MRINSKAFAIPILIAITTANIEPDAVKIGIANALGFIFIHNIHRTTNLTWHAMCPDLSKPTFHTYTHTHTQ